MRKQLENSILRSLLLRFFAVVIFLGGAFFAGAAISSPEPVAKPTVLFGVIPRYNPMIMYRSYQPLMDYLTEKTPYRFELKLSRDYTDAVELLRQGVTPIASLGDLTFAEACLQFGARPILKPLNSRDHADYYSIIIVREDSPIRTLQDLQGRTFAFGNLHSTSGNLIPRHFLFQSGVTLFDLKSYTNLESHDAVAKAVLKGKAEAGAVKDVIAHRYQEHGLRLLAVSGPIPSVPIVVREDAPAEMVRAVESALLAIDPSDPAMRKRMQGWDPEFRHGFVRAAEEDYRPIFHLLESIPGGCGNRCH